MIIAVMEASTVGTPVSNAVHRLAAALSNAIHRAVLVRTFFSVQVWNSVDLVGSAALVLVAINNMGAASIGAPLALAVDRLSATTLRALLELVFMRTSITTVQSRLRDLISTASLIMMMKLIVRACSIVFPSSNTVHRLGTFISSALLKLVGIWASVSVVGRCDRDLVQSAALVLVSFVIMEASIILVPSSNAVHRLGTTSHCALKIAVSIWAGITTMRRDSLHIIGAASGIGVLVFVIETFVVRAPHTVAVHRLGTTFSGALLVGIDVWTSITIVGRICCDNIVSAAPVLVVTAVVEASAVGTPVSNTICRLSASFAFTFNKSILMWALTTIQVSLCGDLVGSAALVLVAISNVVAASVGAPLALAIHRLSTAALRALLELVTMRTSKSIMLGCLQDTIDTATLVFVNIVLIMARIVVTPSANAVNRLITFLSSALLVFMCIRATISTVCGVDTDLVYSAALVAVVVLIIIASTIHVPIASTIHWLRASIHCALNIAVRISTGVAIMRRRSAHSIGTAFLVLVCLVVMSASIIVAPCTQAVHRLGTALRGALLESIRIWASKSIVGRICSNNIVSAAPIFVILIVVEALGVITPASNTINRLCTILCFTLYLSI